MIFPSLLYLGKSKILGSLSNILGKYINSSTIDSLIKNYTGSGLTGAQLEANAFTAAEAEKAREWQEKMYLKYESPEGQVSQLKAAGLNPALMYGQAPTGSVDSSPAMASVSPSAPENLFGILMQFATLKADIDKTRAETRNINANTFGKETENQYLAEQIQLGLNEKKINIDATLAGIREIDSRIALNSATVRNLGFDDQLKQANISLAEFEKALKAMQTSLAAAQTSNAYKQGELLAYNVAEEEFNKAYRDLFGSNPDANIWAQAPTLILYLLEKIGYKLNIVK